jgi:hypothetical protein
MNVLIGKLKQEDLETPLVKSVETNTLKTITNETKTNT